MTQARRDVIVVGGGAMGSAAAWQLSRRGGDVVLLERFGAGHTRGASHGSRRNFNVAYTEPEYIAMLVEAARLWRELESEAATVLLELTGLVDHGADPRADAVHAALETAGVRSSFLPLEEAGARWPGIRFDTRVLYFPDAGTVRADRAVDAMQRVAVQGGVEVRHHHRVISVAIDGDDAVLEVETGDRRERMRARRVVMTAGAWTSRLLGGVVGLPRLTVTHEQPAHFAVRDAATPWPSFNHRRGLGDRYGYWPAPVYGLLDPGEGVKVGWHRAGPVVDPDAPERPTRPDLRAALQRYAREWLPGTDPDDLREISCTYTSTDDTDFVIDRVGPLVLGAGFSGHGFKFTPAVGRMLADLATDGDPQPALFRVAR